MKLNLGCGDDIMAGFINVDINNPRADVQADITNLPYEDNTVNEIFSRSVLEHFPQNQTTAVLKEWKRVLKPGGKMVTFVPGINYWSRMYLEGRISFREFVVRMYGGCEPYMAHLTGFDRHLLLEHHLEAGFERSKLTILEDRDRLGCVAIK